MAAADGSSRLVDAELELSEAVIADGVPPLRVSNAVTTSAAIFIEDRGDASGHQFHPTPAKVLVIIMSGKIAVETGDGERREFSAGEVLLVEDTTGRGHLSMPVTSETRMVMLILPEEE